MNRIRTDQKKTPRIIGIRRRTDDPDNNNDPQDDWGTGSD